MKKILQFIEDDFCAIILLAMTILTFINVFARYILHSSMPFVEELTSLGLVIISLMGAAVAAKRGAHLGLTVLTDFFPQTSQKYFVLLGHLLGAIFSGIIIYFGYFMVQQEYNLKQLTPGMQWPEWMFGIFIPISGVIMLIRFVQLAIMALLKKEKGGENL